MSNAVVQQAQLHAEALGATPATASRAPNDVTTTTGGPSMVAQHLLRRFAEEAREMNQPYPKHWFDAQGGWVGIGKTQSQLALQTSTLKALRDVEASTEVVTSVLEGRCAAAAAAATATNAPPRGRVRNHTRNGARLHPDSSPADACLLARSSLSETLHAAEADIHPSLKKSGD